jgi:hypothetical protein
MKAIFFVILGILSLANAQDSLVTPPPSPSSAVDSNDPASPVSILKRVLTTYKSMPTYCSNGTIVSERMEGTTKIVTTTTFSLNLKKPNFYVITWNQTSIPQALPQGGAVWSDGTQPYLYLLMNKSYAKIGDDVAALGAANAVSAGATNTIPSLFFPAFTDKGFALARLKNPVVERSDFMGGEDCYVLSGASNLSKRETFWISKSSNLILKYEKSLEPPADGVKSPEITEDVIEKALRALGQPVTEENKKQVRDMMKTANGTMVSGDANGISTEMQMEITHPNFAATDFHFTPPSGTTLTDSMAGVQTESRLSAPAPDETRTNSPPVQAP